MRDHGGNIDQAIAAFGGDPHRWIDLSTGINRCPYPITGIPAHAWTDLPTKTARQAACEAASHAYGAAANIILPVAGAQAAIQLIPPLSTPGRAHILSPTYNEHAAALRLFGWQVTEVAHMADLAGADLAVLVNPNNPDGQRFMPQDVLELVDQVGRLVVDESFADVTPELSVVPHCGGKGLLVLRSIGKFYGLAGIRLGFLIGHQDDVSALATMAGPWSVSGPALALGQLALADDSWRAATILRLHREAEQLDAIAAHAGWRLAGGTGLFRTYETPDAATAQSNLARHQIWSRIFPYSKTWLRLGLPGHQDEWTRMQSALSR